MLAHKSFNRQASGRRCRDNRQITHTAQCHVQRSRNGCGGQCQNVNFRAQCLDNFFLFHAESVFLIDNEKS